ncbi:MAG: sulfatase-like hydrolase/transferase, partial [Clostridia bacterium]|nr:sulfatase-like hydrolase/transferase [Clostridia bacterium]
SRNPAGPAFNERRAKPPWRGISNVDYAANFALFLEQKPKDRPFCFWYGAHEPHRSYEAGSGIKSGKELARAEVPPFLPDTPEVRSDLLDYAVEIEWFDHHLEQMLRLLEQTGELDNTLIIVTSDNGMPFPRAKANLYEYGIHVPLAICWPAQIPGNRIIDDPVGFVDLTATILEAAGVKHPHSEDPKLAPVGKSLLQLLRSRMQGRVDLERRFIFAGRERHSSSRYKNLGYPCRAVRNDRFLYIRN